VEQDPRPFTWTKSADEILETIAEYCQRINPPRALAHLPLTCVSMSYDMFVQGFRADGAAPMSSSSSSAGTEGWSTPTGCET
jgi:hypothetical protein